MLLPAEILFRVRHNESARSIDPCLGSTGQRTGIHVGYSCDCLSDDRIDLSVHQPGRDCTPECRGVENATHVVRFDCVCGRNIDGALYGGEVHIGTAPLHGLELLTARLGLFHAQATVARPNIQQEDC